MPLLARLDHDALVGRSQFPGTTMIPAAHAVRAALILPRRSHVMDLLFDEGVALAVGLNALRKATFMSQYSSRLGRKAIVRLLGAWMERLRTARVIDAASFNVDFHSISYCGADPVVEKHYVPRRGPSSRDTPVTGASPALNRATRWVVGGFGHPQKIRSRGEGPHHPAP